MKATKNPKLSILLLTMMVSSTILITPISASATELINNNKISVQKEIKMEDAIKIIENKYLSIKDGKFTISENAKKEIPESILKELEKSIDLTNKNISQNNLKIEEKNNNKFNLEVEEKYKNSNYDLQEKRVKRSGQSNFYKKYGYKFKFFWWGFAAWINRSGTNQLIDGLESLRDTFGGLAIISGAIVPGLTTVASGIGYLGIQSLVTQAKLARNQTGSCITYCYGSPKDGQVYKITPSW
ncbi:hypothetical protein [Clostridium baratii]|uniref:hypothetical protein n=1 Tax=Clostridium baratii TaxID=1561 RepID=UPI0030D09FDA